MQSKELSNTLKDTNKQDVTQQDVHDSTEKKHEMDIQKKTSGSNSSPTKLSSLPVTTASGRIVSKPRRFIEEY